MPSDAAEAASLLRLDQGLFTAVCRFNFEPVGYADPGRLVLLDEQLPAACWQRLRATPRLAGRLSALLLERNDLAGRTWWDFAAPLRRLALVDQPGLMRLAWHAGALLHAQAIRRIVARGLLLALRARIGMDGYEFALKRAPFLGRMPERPEPADLPGAIERDGLSCLAAWLAAEPQAIAGRVRLKFAPGGALDRPERDLVGEAGQKVLAKVLREGDPAWRAYCG